ncbi:Uncharacterised protein [uncultured archaeon]|nr:Uncharacterised protein [uncultured archaeon]
MLLVALGLFIEQNKKETSLSRKKILNNLLINSDETGDQRYKLILTQNDKGTFIDIIEDRELQNPVSNKIVENYNYFLSELKKCKLDPLQIYDAIGKLMIGEIALDQNDNPQLIFESLNSTGLDLSQSDLIRNFILMDLDPEDQAKLYQTYWFPMEKRFAADEYSQKFDRFMRDYLTIKTSGNIPKMKEVYDEFKKHVSCTNKFDKYAVVEDVNYYFKYFAKLALLDNAGEQVAPILGDINALKVDVAYPFLLQLYDDCSKNLLNQEEFIEILKLVESYVFRRAICGIPTNSLNKTFATLSKELIKDKEHYLESFKAALILKP